MPLLDNNRLVRAFAELRSAGRKTLVPFITAGYPDLETTEALLAELAARGVRVCELGIPFSDPIADGPVIQSSYTEALAAGVTSDKVLAMVRGFRQSQGRAASGRASSTGGGPLALVAMISYSIIFRHGPQAFLTAAADAGFDGLIVPDLPLEEAAGFESLSAERGLANVMLIAPTTSPDRRREIARHARGFIYYVSVAGITGERACLPQSAIDAVAELRAQVSTPVCVGFGVSNAATVAQVCQVADGAIVGSAIVHRIRDAAAKRIPRPQLVKLVGDFVRELMTGLNRVS